MKQKPGSLYKLPGVKLFVGLVLVLNKCHAKKRFLETREQLLCDLLL